MKYKKVQTTQTVTYKVIRTYFIDADEPDTDCLCYEPTDEEVIDKSVTDEEVIWQGQCTTQLLKMLKQL